jgi:L-ribulokinase
LSGSAFTIGLDFGTDAVRALLFDVERGEEIGSAVSSYEHGVIVERLPSGRPLAPKSALQSPSDWLASLEQAVRAVLEETGVVAGAVRGIGVGFTSCTILPTDPNGTPLCELERWREEPNAWPKLWKHHAAQEQADQLTARARERAEPWLERYGGRVSSEWLLPKVMEVLDEAPDAYAASAYVLEGGDWVVWQLTGEPVRNACAAGFKALWHKGAGYPSSDFLAALRPPLGEFFAAGAGVGAVAAPGARAGSLRKEWAERLGLSPSVAVAVAIIDAHAGLIGAGIFNPGRLYMATGTSTCHLLLADAELKIQGISGVVEDGILAGAFAYEAGQASAGDMLDWYSRLVQRSHAELTADAATLRIGESGLLALDWWNGCRTPLVDADLSGVVLGATLASEPGSIYRALLEATALGTRLVIDTFGEGGINVESVVAGGGLVKNEVLMQIYADASALPIAVLGSEQPSARGAAILGAAAAGLFCSVAEATAATASAPVRIVEPNEDDRPRAEELFALYRELVDEFGGADSPLKQLSSLQRRTAHAPSLTLSV